MTESNDIVCKIIQAALEKFDCHAKVAMTKDKKSVDCDVLCHSRVETAGHYKKGAT